MMADPVAYRGLCSQFERLHNLDHLLALAAWDRMTMMPRGGAKARADAISELDSLMREMRADARIGQLLGDASKENLGVLEARNLALMQRAYGEATEVPPDLARARSDYRSESLTAWEEARERNDWKTFSAAWSKLVSVEREIAAIKASSLQNSRGCYDACLDAHVEGLRWVKVEVWFEDLLEWLPALRSDALQLARDGSPQVLEGPFPEAKQRDLSQAVMQELGFDFSGGRLDVSVHPFTGGVPDDVRLTTRYREDSFLEAVVATVHETGHALYQQNLPAALRGLPVGEAQSAGMHEGQALFYERELSCEPRVAREIARLASDHLFSGATLKVEEFLRHRHALRNTPIRVEADALAYPLHIILRSRIECALIEERCEVDDVPDLWAEYSRDLLGMEPEENLARGVLQDIHWAHGLIGYFPTYVMGAMIAAQLFEAFSRSDMAIGAADSKEVCDAARDWLSEQVWSKGASASFDAILRDATGEPLGTKALRRSLTSKYCSKPENTVQTAIRTAS